MDVHDLNFRVSNVILSGLCGLKWRMSVGKTLLAQVIEYLPRKNFGRIFEACPAPGLQYDGAALDDHFCRGDDCADPPSLSKRL